MINRIHSTVSSNKGSLDISEYTRILIIVKIIAYLCRINRNKNKERVEFNPYELVKARSYKVSSAGDYKVSSELLSDNRFIYCICQSASIGTWLDRFGDSTARVTVRHSEIGR